jgi:hypothetical protein
MYYSKKKPPFLLASIASMRLFLLTFLISISNSGVETWHIIHLSHSTSFLLFIGLDGHRSCYKTYTSRRNCGFFKVESAGSDHKPDTSQVPLLNEQTDDTSIDIALFIFCGKHLCTSYSKTCGTAGADPGGGAPGGPPLKLEKI